MPLEILIAILESGYGEYDEKWKDGETGGDGGENGEELEDGDGKEEAVGNTPRPNKSATDSMARS